MDRIFTDPLQIGLPIHPPLAICSAVTSISDATAVYRLLNTPVAVIDDRTSRPLADHRLGVG